MSAKKNLFYFLQTNGSGLYSREQLRDAAGKESWERSFRFLKEDGSIDFVYVPENKSYLITDVAHKLQPSVRKSLSAKLRYKIGNRDNHTCQNCGKTPRDGVKLHVDHIVPVDWGGTNDENNLWMLCEKCNLGKKAFYKDEFDPELMKLIEKETSARGRLKVFFTQKPNTKVETAHLQTIARVRDWERALRYLREDGLIIRYLRPTKSDPKSYYINIKR
ncbi:HNH endonuclease [Salinimicrobium xinjiangense]|uniref:HNH endonuclease n=1 Tax=Salinimicrobium xinjiangense TaxID=438596 RepID=UPI0004099A8C|nr:HNH endonuclease [Salinimicrobium xinjiangense]